MAYNYITKHNSPNYTPEGKSKRVFGQARNIKGITIHHWGDPKTKPSFEGVVSYLCRSDGNTSAHLVATGTNRRVACLVNFTDVAWHSGSATGNATTIGIECDPRCRPEDYDVVAEAIADIRSAFGNLPLYPHKHWTPTACPGNYDLRKLDKLASTKISGKEWGQVQTKASPVPPVVSKPTPTPLPPADSLNDEPTPSVPVTEQPDWGKENNALLKQILALLQGLVDKFNGIFK